MKQVCAIFAISLIALMGFFLGSPEVSDKGLSDGEVMARLMEIAQREIQMKDYHAQIGTRRIAIQNQSSQDQFKLEFLQRHILKEFLKEHPRQYSQSIQNLMSKGVLIAQIRHVNSDHRTPLLVPHAIACGLREGT